MSEIHFDKMVNYYRKQNGWTMKELAEKIGKTESAISKWESGISSPKIKDINILSNVLGVDTDSLIFGALPNSESKIISETIELMKKLDEKSQANILNFAKFEYAQAETANQIKEKNASVS